MISDLDIDECLSTPCHSDATCDDIEGSYTCTCKVGTTGDGYNCTGMYLYVVYLLLSDRS